MEHDGQRSPDVFSNLKGYKDTNSHAKPHESLGVVRMYNSQWWGEVRDGVMRTFKLMFNGIDRFATQAGKYFNQMQSFYHHSGNPVPGIYSYSFALKPEVLQPSGTCNFSRIDNAVAVPTINSTDNSYTSRCLP